MQQIDHRITTQQAIAFLNQMEGQLDDAATIAQLQAVEAELTRFSVTTGFIHLPHEIRQRWDALHDQVAEIEESAFHELGDQLGVARSAVNLDAHFSRGRSLSETELEALAKEYVEKLDHANVLSLQAQLFTVTASAAEDAAFKQYENAFEQGASEEGWNAAVQLAKENLHYQHVEEVAALAVQVLNSAEADEVRWDGKIFTFIRDEDRLMIVDEDGRCAINATWAGEYWKYESANLSQPAFLIFKQEIEAELSREIERQNEQQNFLELG
jgi:hypothetical protein